MMDIISKITISEVVLLFLLIFILPGMALLVRRLRKYEALFGDLPEEEKKKGKKKKAAEEDDDLLDDDPPAAPAKEEEEDAKGYPYQSRAFLSPADRACLSSMREALGPDVEVYPKVALWETVESTERSAAHVNRLHGLDYDFLVCDKRTGQVLTAVMFKPGKGRPAGPVDELKRICAAAKANVVFIEMAEEYDARKLKDALGIPDLDI